MSTLRLLVVGVVLYVSAGCNVMPPAADGGDSDVDADVRTALAAHGVTQQSKPQTDPAQVVLGQMLFFDKALSGNRNISCSTCHLPEAATSDDLCLSFGQGGAGRGLDRVPPVDDTGQPVFIPRNATDLFNRASMTVMFWDGRVAEAEDGTLTTPAGDDLFPGLESALAAQAMFPVTSRDEMRGLAGENEIADLADDDFPGMWAMLMDRLFEIDEYVDRFAAAFPEVPAEDLTFVHAANAIAAYEIEHLTLVDAPLDRYLDGEDAALSSSAKQGALLFFGRARCGNCHNGPLLTDERFHNMAVPQLGPGKGDGTDGVWDFGRGRETGDEGDLFRFRTPPLRNVTRTGAWMHNGAYTSLQDAVLHMLDPIGMLDEFDPETLPLLMQDVYRPEQTEEIRAAALEQGEVDAVTLSDAEFDDLMAFLDALASPSVDDLPEIDRPESVPSGLSMDD